jgi:hypothetical protein
METPECPIKSLSLDEAIAHADEVAGDCGTACKREHKQLADWLRELKSRRSADPGDSAKLREALISFVAYSDLVCQMGIFTRAGLIAITATARAALSAPPRNCDRFADETDAQIAFLNEVWLISVTKETALERDKFDNWTDEMRSRYAKWLLATATEQKGQENG